MGLEVLMARNQQRPRWRYQRLVGDGVDDSSPSPAPAAGLCKVRRQLRLRRRRAAPMMVLRKRRKVIRLMRLVFLLPAARRVAALLAEVVRRLAAAAAAVDECPTIVFSSQWGLPVLSHSSSSGGRNAKLRAFYLDRNLSSSSAAAAASPC
uniref:Uncharacterized protein n=1 Tax=Leersia perrieri TaxID=77586 RepID=A0A0D9X1W0_9ORYZ